MFGKLICLMCFVVFVECQQNKGPPNQNNPSGGGHGPPQCNPRNCPHECRFGYVLDQNQCQTCECNVDLCIGKTCPDCHVCAAVSSKCSVEPCPLVANCVCEPPDCQRHYSCRLGYSGKGFGCTVCGICNIGSRIACNILKQFL